MIEAKREIDAQSLKDFAQLVGRDGAGELVGTLLNDLPDRLRDFLDGLQNGDLELARRSVHTLKSSVSYVGAHEFSKFCAMLEQHARARDMQQLVEHRPEFEARVTQLHRELNVLAKDYQS